MVRDQPVRLRGSDDEILDVARRARAAIDADRALAGEVIPALAGLSRARRAAVTPSAKLSASSASMPVAGGWRGVFWTVAVMVGLVAAVAYGWLLTPYRGFTFPPEVVLQVAPVAFVVAIVLLASALLAASVASPTQALSALVISVTAGAMIVFVALYRLVAGAAAPPELNDGQRLWWFAGAAALVSLLAVLSLRLRHRRLRQDAAAGVVWSGDRAIQRERRRLLVEAHRLAARAPYPDSPAVSGWEEALSRLDVSADALAQARELGAVSWLTWVAYDGEIETSTLRLG